jgi:hypothetical protein
VLNATGQTGSVRGVALFGSLVGGDNAFIAGAHASLVISAAVLLAGAVAIWHGRARRGLGRTAGAAPGVIPPRQRLAVGGTQRSVARSYNVSQSTISRRAA